MINAATNLLLIIALLLNVVTANAHNRSESYSNWRLQELEISTIITIPSNEVTRLIPLEENYTSLGAIFKKHAVDNTTVFSNENKCQNSSAQLLSTSMEYISVELQYSCFQDKPTHISYRAMLDIAPSHVHFAKLYSGSDLSQEFLITNATGLWEIDQQKKEASVFSFTEFLKLGIAHIMSGLDHIAFLLALLLVAGGIGKSIVAITGFTVGHSLSLASATLGYVHADREIVESFIGFTIALVATEFFSQKKTSKNLTPYLFFIIMFLTALFGLITNNLSISSASAYIGIGIFSYCYLSTSYQIKTIGSKQSLYLLFVAAVIFGLIHGLGFASFLIDIGSSGTSLIQPLLGFNVGVEIGQLILIAAFWLFAHFSRYRISKSIQSFIAGSLCCIGVFWFISRTFT